VDGVVDLLVDGQCTTGGLAGWQSTWSAVTPGAATGARGAARCARCTPRCGRIEVKASARVGSRSMYSAWMVGIKDEPQRCGAICLVEGFGEAVDGGARRPLGHPLPRAGAAEDFSADRWRSTWRTRTGTRWTGGRGRVEFFVDDQRIRSVQSAGRRPIIRCSSSWASSISPHSSADGAHIRDVSP
jgi:hypothetical protein